MGRRGVNRSGGAGRAGLRGRVGRETARGPRISRSAGLSCRVVGRASRAVSPLQGFSLGASECPASPPCTAPSQGSAAFRSLTRVRSGPSVRRPLHAVSTASRSSALGSARTQASAPAAQAWPPSQGPAAPPTGDRQVPRLPLLGFRVPSTTWARGSASPGFASPGTFRPRGFAPPRRFPPLALRDFESRCRSWDSPTRSGRRRGSPCIVPLRERWPCARRTQRLRCDPVSSSEEHEAVRFAPSTPIAASSEAARRPKTSHRSSGAGPPFGDDPRTTGVAALPRHIPSRAFPAHVAEASQRGRHLRVLRPCVHRAVRPGSPMGFACIAEALPRPPMRRVPKVPAHRRDRRCPGGRNPLVSHIAVTVAPGLPVAPASVLRGPSCSLGMSRSRFGRAGRGMACLAQPRMKVRAPGPLINPERNPQFLSTRAC